LKSDLQEIISGNIHISTIYSIGLHELPPYVTNFLQKYPSVNVRVEYRRSNLVYEDILHNSVDLGLVAFSTQMRQLEMIPFSNDELVLICNPSHPLASRGEVDISEIKDCKIIGFDHDIPSRKATDQIFREHNLDLFPIMEFNNIETVKRAMEIDAGVAIVPQATVLQEINQSTIRGIKLKGDFTRPLAIIHRKGRVLTPAMRKFIDTLTGQVSITDDEVKV